MQITVNGDAIALRVSAGKDTPIVMVHGNSASSRAFQHQLEGTFGAKYRVIAFDLPGHGESSAASNPENYSLPGYAGLIYAVAEELNALDGVFLGWSLGGHAVLEAVPNLPNAAGFVIFGTPPLAIPPAMEAAFMPHPTNAVLFAPELTDEQAQSFADSFFKTSASASFVEDVKNTRGEARLNFGMSVQQGRFRDELAVVQTMTQPLLIIHGEDEQLVNGAFIQQQTIPALWRGEMQIIPGAGHAPQWETPEQFNALVAAFVDEVSAK